MADAQEVRVQVRFTVEEDGYPAFTDAIYLTESEWTAAKKSPAKLDAQKKERHAAWKHHVDNPPVADPVEDVPADPSVDAARQVLLDALAALDAQE